MSFKDLWWYTPNTIAVQKRTIRAKVGDSHTQVQILPLCERAHTLCALAGKDEITPDMMRHIRTLGYSVVEVPTR